MRISTKLTLGLALVSSCIFGANEYWRYIQEKVDLRDAAQRNFTTLSSALRAAVEASLRDQQPADVRRILDSMEVGEPEIDVFVIDQAGSLTADSFYTAHPTGSAHASIADLNLHAQLEDSNAKPEIRFETTEEMPRLVGLFPLFGDAGEKLGAIAIVRPLGSLADDLERTRNSAIVSGLSLITGITFVGWLLVLTYVRRPLKRLTTAMRAVGEGDLTGTVPPRSRDETGAIAAEFNAMVRELEQARRQLLQAVESREMLEQAIQHVDKLVTVGQLSAGLAHEIGSPLQVLSGRARTLAARTDLPADVIRTARILEEQTSRIIRIVDQLLTFARRRVPHMAEIDLGPSITAIVDLLEGEARRRNVHLEYRCPAVLPKITADTDQVQQIAMNLLNNALQATPRGGRVRVSLEESVFPTADGMHEQPSILLTVEDDGPGMSDAMRRRIFEPFFTAWSEGGTGLGLAVVKAIVDNHSGSVVVSSVPGGTSVFVHLPTAGRHVRVGGLVA